MVGGVIGPQKSACSSSNGLEARKDSFFGEDCQDCFPTRHDSYIMVLSFIFGSPRTIYFRNIVFIVLKLICPNRACHLHVSPSNIVLSHMCLPTFRFIL